MGTVPASAVWTIAAKSPGESLWNLVKNQRFRVEKAVFLFSGIAHPSIPPRSLRVSDVIAGAQIGVEAGVG
eukprot:6548-Heterococcus_DN1.PRE.1